MKIDNYIATTTKKLGSETARLDILVLLEDTIGKDRAWILAHQDTEITNTQLVEMNVKIKRRALHEPLAYIRGKTEFYGSEFIVNHYTLEPRPESETIIELLKTNVKGRTFDIVDVGTGSGCLAITAKLEIPNIKVFGTDIDNKCIQAAQANAKKHNVSIDFRQGDLLEPLKHDLASDWIIIANLPYVPDGHIINQAAMFEPESAIFGGSDGLDLYRKMFTQIDGFDNKPIYIITESLPFQHQDLANLAKYHGFKQLKEDDFIQVLNIV